MNASILGNLKTKDILSTEDIKQIRESIKKNYHNCSIEQANLIFSKEIRRRLSSTIFQFEEAHRNNIIDNVLKKTVFKRVFSINGEEILSTCVGLKIKAVDYVNSLTRWINENQSIEISEKEVRDFIIKIDGYSDEIVHYNLERVIQNVYKSEIAEVSSLPAVIYKNPFESSEGQTFEESAVTVQNEIPRISLNTLIKLNLKHKALLVLVSMLAACLIFIININRLLIQDTAVLSPELSDIKPIYSSLIFEEYIAVKAESDQFIYEINHELDEKLTYKSIDANQLKKWLKSKKSILAEEPYFSTIINTAHKYDIDPLLMFAITGQEQSFVPKNKKNAKTVANNPFNVHGSWMKYNTNIADSSEIAAKTILKLSKNRPAYVDPIQWINRKYAQDPNWWKKVKLIYEQLSRAVL